MKPLSIEETALKEEMKERCLTKGQYIDEKAKEKFKMLCHLENFEVEFWNLQQENQQLKNNWNELKEWLEKYWQQSQDIWFVKIINKMQELERGGINE